MAGSHRRAAAEHEVESLSTLTFSWWGGVGNTLTALLPTQVVWNWKIKASWLWRELSLSHWFKECHVFLCKMFYFLSTTLTKSPTFCPLTFHSLKFILVLPVTALPHLNSFCTHLNCLCFSNTTSLKVTSWFTSTILLCAPSSMPLFVHWTISLSILRKTTNNDRPKWKLTFWKQICGTLITGHLLYCFWTSLTCN